MDNVLLAAEILHEQGVEATVLRLLSLSHIPTEEIAGFMQENSRLVVVEDACENSGINERLGWELAKLGQYRVDGLDLGHRYVTHGSVKQLHEHYGLSGEKIAKYIMEGVQSEN